VFFSNRIQSFNFNFLYSYVDILLEEKFWKQKNVSEETYNAIETTLIAFIFQVNFHFIFYIFEL